MEKLKVLVVDIETAPITARVWETIDVNIASNQIVKDWYIIAFSAKWLGGKQQVYYDKSKSWRNENDRPLVKKLWKLIDTADIVLGQNSKAFDTKKIAARMQFHGILPPSGYKHLDTYLMAKASGSFTKNSLEYLAVYLKCKHQKLLHENFPGMALWNECLAGNKKAWAEMKRYNMNDVLVTEDLYDKLKPWAPKNSPAVYHSDDKADCTVCGRKMQGNGVRSGMNRFRCLNCGKSLTIKIKKVA